MRLGPNDRQQCGTHGAHVRHAAHGRECRMCEMAEPTVDPIVAALRLERKRLGLRQKDVADRAGIDASTISLMESGRTSPTMYVVRAVAGALGMSISCEVESDGRS